MLPRNTVSALFIIAAFAACRPAATRPESAPATKAVRLDPPRLLDSHPCAGKPGFTCAMLNVPLDYRNPARETLKLQVAMTDNTDAPKGVLLFLHGGPGQPGVPSMARLTERMPQAARDYRLVVLDQRGTGEFGAIDCPALQAQVGSGSDVIPATPDAIIACATSLGDKAPLYSSDDTIADLDRLRQALGVEKMVVDGVSYGSITAARYAITYPRNVQKVILDSVVPHHSTAEYSLYLGALRAGGRVLREACAAAPACGFDPAGDLAALVRSRDTAASVRLLDTLITYEFIDPTYRNPSPPGFPAGLGDIAGALHAARQGDTAHLERLMKRLEPGGGPSAKFSMGLHTATICADLRFPWGDASTPIEVRAERLDGAEKRLRDADTWPFTAAVAVNQGFVKTCQRWPVERAASNPDGPLPDVPVLLLSGDRDISTPTEWAQYESTQAPQGKLVVVRGESHSIQNRERGHAGRDAVLDFLSQP